MKTDDLFYFGQKAQVFEKYIHECEIKTQMAVTVPKKKKQTNTQNMVSQLYWETRTFC